MKKYLPVVAALILISIVIAANLLKDVVRVWVVAPLFDLLDGINRNQSMVWIFFLMILAFVIIKKIVELAQDSLLDSILEHFGRKKPEIHMGEIQQMADWIEYTRTGIRTPNRLAKYLGQLFLEVMAHNQKQSPKTILNRLKTNSLEVSPELNAYFRGVLLLEYSIPSRWSKLVFWKKPPPSPFDLDPETIIEFLENQMYARK